MLSGAGHRARLALAARERNLREVHTGGRYVPITGNKATTAVFV
jgi:hypothetical protein